MLLQATKRLAEAEPLMRRALAINERSKHPDDPEVAISLFNLALLLQATNRVAEAEPLMARVVRVFSRLQRSTGHEHPYLPAALENYRQLLTRAALPPLAVIDASAALKAARTRYRDRETLTKLALNQKATPWLEKVLGPVKPTKEILGGSTGENHEKGKPSVWLPPLNEPIAPQLDQLLGSTKTPQEVLDALDRRYHQQKKPAVWFLSLDEPITPHLDELLGEPSK